MSDAKQEIRELRYLLEVARLRHEHLRTAIAEVLRHTGKICIEEWGRERIDAYLREQMATTPPLPDKRILAGGAEPIDWYARADQYARDLLEMQAVYLPLWVAACAHEITLRENNYSESGEPLYMLYGHEAKPFFDALAALKRKAL